MHSVMQSPIEWWESFLPLCPIPCTQEAIAAIISKETGPMEFMVPKGFYGSSA